MKEKKPEATPVTTNHEARRDYFILETLEAGLALQGSEVKSLRMGGASLSGSFAYIEDGEAFVHHLYIAPYKMATQDAPEPLRKRKLLLHGREIARLQEQVAQKGLALIPLKLYFNKHGLVKLELGVGRGKKLYDKRSDIKQRQVNREIDRAIKNRNRK